MVRHGGSSAGSYLAEPMSPIPSHCASIVVTSTVRANFVQVINLQMFHGAPIESADDLLQNINCYRVLCELY